MNSYNEYSDIELFKSVATYDSKALEELYERYSPIFYTIIKKIVTDKKLAEQTLVDVFAIIWKRSHYFDLNKDNVYTWLITLTRNKAVDSLKRMNEKSSLSGYSDEYEIEFIVPKLSSKIDRFDLQTAFSISGKVENALNKLTDAQQYVLYLAYYEGLTYEEIATKLNLPTPTVASKIMIASNNLKENLLTEGEE